MRKSFQYARAVVGLTLLPFSTAVAAEPGANSLDYPGPAWSPYIVGAGIGVLSWLTFYFSHKPIGASSFYAQVAGFLGKLFAPRHTRSLAYFKEKPPRVGWGFAFVVATIVGGAIAALTGGEFANEWLPPMWEHRLVTALACVPRSDLVAAYSWPLAHDWREVAPAATALAAPCNSTLDPGFP
jgi:hypothetical protein